MNKKDIENSKQELGQFELGITNLISQYSEGLGIQEIFKRIKFNKSQRTLQRTLAHLVKAGHLVINGLGRDTRYLIVQTYPVTKHKEDYLPISKSAEKIKQYIRQPIQMRKPVGFNMNFLDDYIPNETNYLSETIRSHLNTIGKSNGNRPAGTYARQILNRLLIDLSWNSSRLEGNTYSLLDTEKLINLGEIVEGKGALEAQMILNHKDAIEFLVNSAEDITFNRYTILNLHALLSYNLLGNSEACGKLRSIPVAISHTVYHPLEIPQLVDEHFQKILDKAKIIKNPFEQAFFSMVHLPYLQPFEDVNKRVSRLSANIPFIKYNLCPLSFIDVPEKTYIDAILGVYELNRTELLRDVFIWAYERSAARYSAIRVSMGTPDIFRIRYRDKITFIVGEVVRKNLHKKAALDFIKKWIQGNIPQEDQPQFFKVTENELQSLHEGNFARYRIRPNEFSQWKSN